MNNSKNSSYALCLTLLVFMVIWSAFSVGAWADPEASKRILLIRTVDALRFDNSKIMSGLYSALNPDEHNLEIVDIHESYISDSDYAKAVEKSIEAMARVGGAFDLVIVLRNPAVEFILEYPAGLGDGPYVIGMVEDSELEMAVRELAAAHIVLEPALLSENLLVAEAIMDGLDEVIAVVDDEDSISYLEADFDSIQSPNRQGPALRVINAENELLGPLEFTPESTMIFFMSQREPWEVLGELTEQAVILTPMEHLIKNGVSGGRVLDSRDYGLAMGDAAMTILNEGNDEGVSVHEASSVYVFDHRQIELHQVDLSWIGNEVRLINVIKPDSEPEPRGLWKWGAALMVLVGASAIAYVRRRASSGDQRMSGQADERFAEIVDATETGISVKDQERRYIYCNEGFRDMLGINRNAKGVKDKDIFDQAFASELEMIDDRAAFGSDDYHKILPYRHPVRGLVYLSIRVKKMVIEEGKLHLVSYYRDISELKKHEKTIAELEKVLDQQVRDRSGDLIQAERMAMMGTVMAGVSHEISTPIGISITASTFISDQSRSVRRKLEEGTLRKSDLLGFVEQLDETGEILYNNLSNAADMISSLKKVAVDQASDEIREFNLKDYVRAAVLNLKPKFKHTKHKIKVTGSESLVLYSYPGAINQVLTNLILNSLTHGFEGIEAGEIVITVEDAKSEDLARLEYKDNGVGISKENLTRVFDPFYTTKREQGGSGLGMNIVRSLIENTLGGTISADSDEGSGVCFTIELPKRINVYESRSLQNKNRAGSDEKTPGG